MPTRPGDPAMIHGITLLPRYDGDTVTGALQCAAPSRETDILIAPGPIGAPLLGYSDQTAYRLPAVSIRMAGKRLPTCQLPLTRAKLSCQFTFLRSWSPDAICVGSVQSFATAAAV